MAEWTSPTSWVHLNSCPQEYQQGPLTKKWRLKYK